MVSGSGARRLQPAPRMVPALRAHLEGLGVAGQREPQLLRRGGGRVNEHDGGGGAEGNRATRPAACQARQLLPQVVLGRWGCGRGEGGR